MYKVSEVAKDANVSVVSVYKAVKQLNKLYVSLIDGVTYINEDGYKELIQRFSNSKLGKKVSKKDDDIVLSLLRQLEEKDRQLEEKDKQIGEKDKQISQLIEQSRNYQVLLKAEQDRNSLQASKRGILAYLFLRRIRTLLRSNAIV